MLLPITQAIIFQRQEGAVPPWTNLVQVSRLRRWAWWAKAAAAVDYGAHILQLYRATAGEVSSTARTLQAQVSAAAQAQEMQMIFKDLRLVNRA